VVEITERVVVKKVENVYENIYETLKEAIELIGFEVEENDFIVIKPNLCDFRPSWEGSTTDPRIVQAFIEIIREKSNPKIAIVESDHLVGNADDEFERMGYRELAENLNVELINLSKDKKYEVALEGYFFETLESTETLLKATKVVSIAKLKTHSQQKITCSMKNLFGLLPRKAKVKYHPFMNEVLADLCEFYKPSLCIIDGIIAMEGAGPSDGDKKELGIIICGRNPVATDAVAAKIMGFDPKKVPHLKFAEKQELGTTKDIEILGDNSLINSLEKFEFIPFLSYLSHRLSFLTVRLGSKVNNSLDGLSKFLSQGSVGLNVLINGYYFTADFGMLFRKNAISYARGLILRPFVLLKMKVKGLV
jgi:uncharacterized protein (DUF362 family)